MTNDEIEEIFINDTKDHSMEVIYDNGGTSRRIMFSDNGSSVYQYIIHTWPGYLMITGDMGTYVFRRINDMFDFFDTGSSNYKINTGYWAEKLEAINSNCGQDASIMEYKEELFEKMIGDETQQYIDDNELKIEDANKLWEAVTDDVLDYKEDEHSAIQSAYDFRDDDTECRFYELPLNRCRAYKFHYIWILYAIVDGIKQYKDSRIVK